MALDGLFLHCIRQELENAVIGAKVDKVYQPSSEELVLTLRSRDLGALKLLLCARANSPRIHLTKATFENPATPPMLCMLLRKHLSGGRLVEISQPPMERCATFTFDCTDEMGFPVQMRLVAELMGRTCNLYLLSPEGRILDCLRRIGLDESIKRAALPGLNYQAPEPMDKLDCTGWEASQFADILTQSGADELSQRLMDKLGGFSPLVCREAALFTAGDTGARVETLDIADAAEKLSLFFREHMTHPAPYYYTQSDGTPKQFAFCPIRQYGDYKEAESFGALLDMYYTVRDRKDAMRQKSQAVRKTVQNLCTRLTRKLAIQEKELEATYDRERLRQLGDILTANLHRMKKGQTVVAVEDFYDEEMKTIEVPLSPVLSPQENAAKYYKNYSRMKNAEKELTRQIELGETELSYLESVLESLSRVRSDRELDEIRQEYDLSILMTTHDFSTLSREEARAALGLDEHDLFVLSFGGSLGAEHLSDAVVRLAASLASDPQVTLLHATGKRDYERVRAAWDATPAAASPRLQLVDYIYDMPLRMAAADLVISRAGAMSVSELALMGKAAVLVTSPYVAEEPQLKNAMAADLFPRCSHVESIVCLSK
mgnify:CR=1 FL=1